MDAMQMESDKIPKTNYSNEIISKLTKNNYGVVLRGDLASIKFGNACILGDNVKIVPPIDRVSHNTKHASISIGSYVFIDEGSAVTSIDIGSNGHRSKISHMCYICDGSDVLNNSVIPPMSIVEGSPATEACLCTSQGGSENFAKIIAINVK
ncbi:LOW QUALITY PROTEIN: hypothetical protein MXB_1086 [Myxobolus squamalis]|nr:LOW QUALITY PROTEIN: hypothetical protein MXB_1086 [Myxobolus squamalis]